MPVLEDRNVTKLRDGQHDRNFRKNKISKTEKKVQKGKSVGITERKLTDIIQ